MAQSLEQVPETQQDIPPAVQAEDRGLPRAQALQRGDFVALALILAGYAVALLAMPLGRDFAYMDDWTYANAVQGILAGEGFRPAEYAQMTLATHAYWGALFAWLFGYSFTVLNAATMAMSLVAAIAFYALLRVLGFGAAWSGLGVAVLALNPYYLIFSYSFMTEITFLALVLICCLFYFLGLRQGGDGWLWLGAVVAALAFLTRQFALAAPLAALIWLIWSRRLTWRRALAVAALPAIALVGYTLWSSQFGTTFSGSVGREALLALLRPGTWASRAAHFAYLALFLPGLTIPLFVRVKHWKIVGALSLAAAGAVYVLWQVKNQQVEQGESTLGELSYYWLQPFWGDPTPIYCLGAALTVWLLAAIVERTWPAFIALVRGRRRPAPPDFLYLTAAILFLGTYLVSGGFLDRYWLPLLPLLIAAVLALVRAGSRLLLVPTALALLLLASYGAAAHLDDYDLFAAHWRGGEWLIAQGIPLTQIDNYLGWKGYYLYDESLARLGERDVTKIGPVFPPDLYIEPEYVVDRAQYPGYRVLQTFPYLSRLGGLASREMYVMQREGEAP